MAWTKRQLVEQAFDDLGYSSYVFDLDAGRLEAALRRLDAMMAKWNGEGIRLGYPLASNPAQSDLDQDSGVPDTAILAITTNLALMIAPSVGKTAPIELKATARAAYDVLVALDTAPHEMQLPDTLPMGAGNKPWNYNQPFFPTPEDDLDAGEDGPLDFN